MGTAILIYVILTLVGAIPFLRQLLKKSVWTIPSDEKYADMPIQDMHEKLAQSARDWLNRVSDGYPCSDVNFYEMSYGYFGHIVMFQETRFGQVQLVSREDYDRIAAVVRVWWGPPRYPSLESAPDINDYLVIAMANGDVYEVVDRNIPQGRIDFLRNKALVGQLVRDPSSWRRWLWPSAWDVIVSDQRWGELKSLHRFVGWDSYRVFNKDFPEGLPVKATEYRPFYWPLVVGFNAVALTLLLWTMYLYWFKRTRLARIKWLKEINDTVLVTKADLTPEQTEMYFLISIYIRCIVHGGDFFHSGFS